jgi:hypothetical protein
MKPLWTDEQTLRKLQALGRLRFVGVNGIQVRRVNEVVSIIGPRRQAPGIATAGGIFTPVIVANDGGTPGTSYREDDQSYAVWAKGANIEVDDPIATGLVPMSRATRMGRYDVAPDGSFGLITTAFTGQIQLFWVYEHYLGTAVCNSTIDV